MNTASIGKRDRLKAAVGVFRLLSDIDWTDWKELRQVRGTLEATRQNLDLAGQFEAAGFLESDGPLPAAATQPPQEIRVTLFLSELRSGEAYFARNLGDMLAEKWSLRFRQPGTFYLAETDPALTAGYLHPDDEANKHVAVIKYLNTLRLVALLEEVSDKPDEKGEEKELFFKIRRSLTLPIDYSAADLVTLDSSRLQKLEDLFEAKVHRRQIRDILKSALLETLDGTRQRFVDLLRLFDDFFRRFDDNYLLFISELSFEKIREQAEQHRLKYTDQLNGVFAGIQNKLLAIPVALVIVAGQIEGEEGASLGNWMILLGAAVFALLMWLLVQNQEHTLEALNAEIQRENKRLAEHTEIQAKLEEIYEDLAARYRHHRSLLRWIKLLVAISVLLPLAAFLYYGFFQEPPPPALPPFPL